MQEDTGGCEARAGRFSTHREVAKNGMTHLSDRECKAVHLTFIHKVKRQRQKMETKSLTDFIYILRYTLKYTYKKKEMQIGLHKHIHATGRRPYASGLF